jgi:ornithine--oxo-acid transaminase
MMTDTRSILEITDRFGAHNYHPLPVVISHAEGIWVSDPEGTRYVDMLSAYSAVNHGHRHPRVVDAARSQLEKVTLTSRAFHNDQLGPFMKELAELCGMEMVLPMNTGAEAVETALKTARKWGCRKKGIRDGDQQIIVCHDNFHGRTITIVSFSTEAQYRDGFGPLTPGFTTIPFGSPEDLKKAITPNTVAFLVEPMQGEAGVNIPPDGYMREVRELCTDADILLIADEIQTGLGRTGRMFCCDHDEVKPDMYVLGKALGGGLLPISAVVSTTETLGVFNPGDHGSTFGGNPLACAVAREALKVLIDEGLAERAAELGAYFLKRLREIDYPLIAEVRGRGLLIGVELKKEAGGARRYCEMLMKKGLLCKETHEDVVRFAPPLIITEEEIDRAMESIIEVFQ